MMKKPVPTNALAEQVVKDIRRSTRKLHSSELNRLVFGTKKLIKRPLFQAGLPAIVV